MQIVKAFWKGFQKVGLFIGNIVSTTILTVFYFTIFALFAVPFRLFGQTFWRQSQNSNWVKKNKNILALLDLESE